MKKENFTEFEKFYTNGGDRPDEDIKKMLLLSCILIGVMLSFLIAWISSKLAIEIVKRSVLFSITNNSKLAW